jgi:hydrogenase nickel incorporation protein HypA/HybF
MHEMSIACDILRCAVEAAGRHGAQRIEELVVEIGPMRQVMAEALQAAFEMISEGTPAEGAAMKVIETAIKATCRDCGCGFEPTIDNFLCPRCEQANVEITGGNDIVLKSVSCEVQ